MNDQSKLESQVQEWLEEIQPVPPRNPQAAARGRAHFLGQAVSAGEVQRHKGWSSIFRKERFAMNMLLSVLVIAGLLFGGGATVNAAQDDLPGQPLYAVKMWNEEVSLRFQNDPQDRAVRLMELAQVRVREITRLAQAGQSIPEPVRLRLEQHINQALQLCSQMEDTQLDGCLLQARQRLQDQFREMEQLRLQTPGQGGPVMEQTRSMLQQRLHLAEAGLGDHEMFRAAVRNGFRFGQDEDLTPPAQNGPGPQSGQPADIPVGPNPDPAGPNPAPGGPNTDPTGPRINSTPSPAKDGSGSGGSGSGGSGTGGPHPGGSGGSGSGGSGSGGGGESGSGGGGSGGNKP